MSSQAQANWMRRYVSRRCMRVLRTVVGARVPQRKPLGHSVVTSTWGPRHCLESIDFPLLHPHANDFPSIYNWSQLCLVVCSLHRGDCLMLHHFASCLCAQWTPSEARTTASCDFGRPTSQQIKSRRPRDNPEGQSFPTSCQRPFWLPSAQW